MKVEVELLPAAPRRRRAASSAGLAVSSTARARCFFLLGSGAEAASAGNASRNVLMPKAFCQANGSSEMSAARASAKRRSSARASSSESRFRSSSSARRLASC